MFALEIPPDRGNGHFRLRGVGRPGRGNSFQIESVSALKISDISSVLPGSAWSETSCKYRSDWEFNSCDTTNRWSEDTYSSTGY